MTDYHIDTTHRAELENSHCTYKLEGRKKDKTGSTRGTPHTVPMAPNPPFVYIRVRTADLVQLTGHHWESDHLYLIKGSFEDIAYYAGSTVNWIIKVAHLLCNPLGVGHVFTHTSGSSDDWYNSSRTPAWREVVQGDQLLPGIYEFESSDSILLAKICNRQSRSKTTKSSESTATTFRNHTFARDLSCVVTRLAEPTIASHLIPKRLRSEGAKAIVEQFAGTKDAAGIHDFDPRIGVTLVSPVATLVDRFKTGFYHDNNNTYYIHNFGAPDVLITGLKPVPGFPSALPLLHRYRVTLSAPPGTAPLPLTGVFNWHYLQCVITRFVTQEYRNVPEIDFRVYPFRTDSDSSDETDSDDLALNPPYPLYRLDRHIGRLQKLQEDKERHKEVQEWASGISSGV